MGREERLACKPKWGSDQHERLASAVCQDSDTGLGSRDGGGFRPNSGTASIPATYACMFSGIDTLSDQGFGHIV